MKTREDLKKVLIDGTNMLVGAYWLGNDNFKARYNKGKNIGTPCIFIGDVNLKGDIDKQVEDAVEYLLNIIYN